LQTGKTMEEPKVYLQQLNDANLALRHHWAGVYSLFTKS
jgi:hypothetical protein